MLTSPQIELARGIAFRAHEGQVDKIKAPYIEHPEMVADFVQLLPDFAAADAPTQESAVCAAWLHDVIEDTAMSKESLEAVGITPAVVVAVVALTRTKNVPSEDYYATIRSHFVAKLVKAADIASNLAPERAAKLDAATKERLQGKYSKALESLGIDPSVITELHAVVADRRDPPSHFSRKGSGRLIDLHTHSNQSDGTDSPRILVMKARNANITHLAITDHDTTAGWAEATEAAKWVDVNLIRGIELTTDNQGQSQHLLAYEPDPTHPGLVELLRRTLVARQTRIPLMVARIAAQVPALRLEDVLRHAGTGTPGKPHIADALVACGACGNRSEAFEKYLDRGLEFYVARWSPAIEDAIQTVVAAGGVPVIAHPWGKGAHVTARRFEQLRDCGLRGVEVNHVEHDKPARAQLAAIASELGLVVTGSSDHHGLGKLHNDLASETTAPDQFERLQSLWSNSPAVA